MERFERETFHDRGKSAEMWAGLEGRSEVDRTDSGEKSQSQDCPNSKTGIEQNENTAGR